MSAPTRAALPILHTSLCFALVALLAGCGDGDRAPQAEAGDVTRAVVDAATASTATHPLCRTATFAQVQAVIGGTIDKVDVIEDGSMPSVDCVYLDTSDVYAGLSLRFFTTQALAAVGSQWSTAAEYYAEWARHGTPVAGLGDAAAWVELPEGLLVQSGDTALRISASKLDLSDPGVRARIETLAREVVAKLP